MKTAKKRVLVACSGGPDSMALLDMVKDEYDVHVAHINYHKRRTANRDERIVRDYCHKHDIPFHKKDYKDDKSSGNFQDKARVFRYLFFAECIREYGLECVLVAHHRDDLIETYLLQKKRKGDVSYYGLKRNVVIKDVRVSRPLLKYTKKDLLDYCHKNGIGYGIDESNLSDLYTRNRIRHELVEKMSDDDKRILIREINEKNRVQKEAIRKAKAYLQKRKTMPVREFLDYDDKVRLLRIFLDINISSKEAEELIRQIREADSFETLIKDKYLVKEYSYLEVFPKEEDYVYRLDDIRCFKDRHFRLARKGGRKEGVYVTEEDLPLTVRNYREGDAISMRYGTKKIRRFFIDSKISSRERKTWPVMCNSEGNVILVPGIGCDRHHYREKYNLYMLKL